jgi:hypothetical protein
VDLGSREPSGTSSQPVAEGIGSVTLELLLSRWRGRTEPARELPGNLTEPLFVLNLMKEAIMTQVDFTQEEIDILGEILTSYLSELRMEIAATDSRELRSSMKEKEALIKKLMGRLGTVQEYPAT